MKTVIEKRERESTRELEAFRHLIQDVYPSGFVSIVSDTFDLWTVLGEYLPALKDEILARDGRVVIRPDSGDPVDIICGLDPHFSDHQGPFPTDGRKVYEGYFPAMGVIETLWHIFGGTINEKGYKVLDPHIGAIYGDSITMDRAEQILDRLEQKGFASGNIVFGIGSFTYQYQTRDTFNFALKSTWAQINGEERFLFKNPKTDDGMKTSLKGRVVVYQQFNNSPRGEIRVEDGHTQEEVRIFNGINLLQPIFKNGEVYNKQSLKTIRETLLSNLEES